METSHRSEWWRHRKRTMHACRGQVTIDLSDGGQLVLYDPSRYDRRSSGSRIQGSQGSRISRISRIPPGDPAQWQGQNGIYSYYKIINYGKLTKLQTRNGLLLITLVSHNWANQLTQPDTTTQTPPHTTPHGTSTGYPGVTDTSTSLTMFLL